MIWLICLPWRCFYHQPGDKPSTFSPSTGLWSIVPTRIIIQLSFHGVYILYVCVCIYSIRHVPQYNLITRARAKLSMYIIIYIYIIHSSNDSSTSQVRNLLWSTASTRMGQISHSSSAMAVKPQGTNLV